MSASIPPKDFIGKADRLLRWAQFSFAEMLKYGSNGCMDDIERTFFNLLTQVAVLHESMASDAKACSLIDWRRDFNALRSSEPLLRYFWKARDSDVHDAIRVVPGAKLLIS